MAICSKKITGCELRSSGCESEITISNNCSWIFAIILPDGCAKPQNRHVALAKVQTVKDVAKPRKRREVSYETSQITERIGGVARELESLRAVRKLLNVRLHGSALGKSKRGRAGETNCEERRDKIYDFLAENEPCLSRTISESLGIPSGTMTALMRHEWFQKTPEGWVIAKKR